MLLLAERCEASLDARRASLDRVPRCMYTRGADGMYARRCWRSVFSNNDPPYRPDVTGGLGHELFGSVLR